MTKPRALAHVSLQETIPLWSKDGVEFLEVWKCVDGHPYLVYRNTEAGVCDTIIATESKKEWLGQILRTILKSYEDMALSQVDANAIMAPFLERHKHRFEQMVRLICWNKGRVYKC